MRKQRYFRVKLATN